MAGYEQETIACEQLPLELKAVLDYWESIRGDRFAPSWPEFDLLQLPLPLIPDVHVVDIIAPEDGLFRFRFWGSNLSQIYHQDNTNKTIVDLQPRALAATVEESLKSMFMLRAPAGYLSEILTPSGLEKFQVLLRLPLSKDGDNVDHIVTSLLYFRDRSASEEMFGHQIKVAS